VIEADGVGIERQADVLDAVGAQKVEGDRADAGHHAGPGAYAAGVLAQGHVADVMGAVVSRPEEFHLRPLVELCVRLSPHTAPIRRTRR